ncbi:unnamed protein product [Adineta ricciae]|uniref:alpha-1,2-Mannosidase n=2 Tax=Adineta ricciae TaxID=249248 RepID=A0A815ELG0_ADIRI|nr:unnamed protein product [Adineta ricciae]
MCVKIVQVVFLISAIMAMSPEEKSKLRVRVLDMFKHGFGSYMKYAFPADELMPLSCKGRYRGSEPSRGDIDDALGNFSLTLVDSLDTLAVLGMFDEFEHAVRQVIQHVSFDRDVIVSVFETNIRMIGGLLGGHISAKYINSYHPLRLSWYRDELLVLAHDLGLRLLPAFNTSSGLPLPRVNLRHGIDLTLSKSDRERFTCTACAGTLILEWATLSRLTGNYLFEQYADRAMSYLWERRHRQSNLMGTILNVHSGDWIVREAGIGAGIDSYYEYLFKAYVLLGEKNTDYLARFQEHYSSIMSYVQQGVAMVNVHMHQPYRLAKNHMDALLAFWPGLQVMTGDLKPAIELHEMLYQVVKKHKFLPEAFTTDYRIHWNSHPLRPEFVESTYFIYKATGDPHYLEVGRTILNNLEEHARVPCGYAAISDVSTGQQEDRMDSFVLAETFKYLYLLFDTSPHRYIDVDQFVFTTEAHILPLDLFAFHVNETLQKEFDRQTLLSARLYEQKNLSLTERFNEKRAKYNQCPAMDDQFQSHQYKEQLRRNIRGDQDMTETITTTSAIEPEKRSKNESHNRLTALEFSAVNPDHITQLSNMGIQIQTMTDGRVQLIHNSATAASHEDAEDGLLFIQEMMDMMKNINGLNPTSSESNYHVPLSIIPLIDNTEEKRHSFAVGSAQFGKQLHGKSGIFAQLHVAQPFSACSQLFSSHFLHSRIGIVRRGDCMFIEKARRLENVHAIGGIVIDHNTSLKSSTNGIFSMTGDGNNDVHIPVVLMFKEEAFHLLHLLTKYPNLIVYVGDERCLKESFYEQLEVLESLVEPRDQITNRWIYGQMTLFEKRSTCPMVPKKLKGFEQKIQSQPEPIDTPPIVQFEHFTDTNNNKPVDEITSQLFASLNLTTANLGGQLHNIEAYRSALNKVVRAAIVSANQSLAANTTATQNQEQEVEIPVIIEQQPLTTTMDTREYTEKRSESEERN